MSKCKILLTKDFKLDFINIYTYIADVLLVPEIAKKLANRILEQIEMLDEMPNRFPLVEKEPWHSRGLRKLVIENYVIFYYPNAQTSEVIVFHIFYSGRDIDNLLKNKKFTSIK